MCVCVLIIRKLADNGAASVAVIDFGVTLLATVH